MNLFHHKKDIGGLPPTHTLGRKVSLATIIFFVVAAILFILAAYYSTTIEKHIRLFGQVNVYWLILAVLGQALTYAFGAAIYGDLLGIFMKRTIPYTDLFRGTLISIFLNQFIPSGGLSGNAYIFHLLSRRHIPVTNVTTIIVLELLSFYLAIATLILVALFIGWPLLQDAQPLLILLIIGLLAFLLLALAVSLVGRKQSIRWVYHRLQKIRFLKNFLDRLRSKIPEGVSIEQMENPWDVARSHPSKVIRSILLQACVVLADTGTIYALFYGLGEPFGFHLILITLLLTRVVSLAPLSPGSLIVFEGSMSFFFTSFGAPLSVALIVTLLYRTLSFWLPLPIGFLMYRGLSRRETN